MNTATEYTAEEIVEGAPTSLQQRLAAMAVADRELAEFLQATMPHGSQTYLSEVGALDEHGALTELGVAAASAAARLHVPEHDLQALRWTGRGQPPAPPGEARRASAMRHVTGRGRR